MVSKTRADQDSPWKEVLRQYFPEAIVFFFPHTADQIDWTRPCEFLDKEFQQIAIDAELGKRYADQLVKVWSLQGEECWLLIHVEVQAKPEPHFAERMWVYHFRIFDRFHKHPSSLAILCDRQKSWRPTEYTYVSTDTELHFRFNIAKLLDYNDRLTALEESSNPFATIVLAHLQTQATRKNSPQRKENKLTLTRRLYEKGFDRQDILSLFRFIDWVMILEPQEENEFWQTLKSYEEERRMPYITTVEQRGYETGLQQGLKQGVQQGLQQGVQQGVQQGLQQGQRSFLLRLLKRRVGELPEAMQTQIEGLAIEAIVQLGEDLLDFTELADLDRWLTNRARPDLVADEFRQA